MFAVCWLLDVSCVLAAGRCLLGADFWLLAAGCQVLRAVGCCWLLATRWQLPLSGCRSPAADYIARLLPTPPWGILSVAITNNFAAGREAVTHQEPIKTYTWYNLPGDRVYRQTARIGLFQKSNTYNTLTLYFGILISFISNIKVRTQGVSSENTILSISEITMNNRQCVSRQRYLKSRDKEQLNMRIVCAYKCIHAIKPNKPNSVHGPNFTKQKRKERSFQQIDPMYTVSCGAHLSKRKIKQRGVLHCSCVKKAQATMSLHCTATRPINC